MCGIDPIQCSASKNPEKNLRKQLSLSADRTAATADMAETSVQQRAAGKGGGIAAGVVAVGVARGRKGDH